MAYESTNVPVAKSQGMIRDLLVKHGATSFEFGEARDENDRLWAAVGFTLGPRGVRIRVPHKEIDKTAVARKLQRARSKLAIDIRAEMEEQEARRIWRVMGWNLKARLEAVEEGVETFEQAFLAHLVADVVTGETVYERLARGGALELDVPGTKLLGAGA